MKPIDESSTNRSNLTIAIAQAEAVPGDSTANLDKVRQLSEEAATKGADIVNFPEKFLTGYEPQLLKQMGDSALITPDDDSVLFLRQLSQRLALTIVVGAPTMINAVRRISSLIATPDGNMDFYHKQHLFHSEKDWFIAGTEDKKIVVKGWQIGLGICYDAGFPEHARRLALDQCDVYLVSALFSKIIGRQELSVWMPARALDNTIYVAMSNYYGTTGGWRTCGRSGVWSPMGECIAQAKEDEGELLIVDLEYGAIKIARESERMLSDYSSIYC